MAPLIDVEPEVYDAASKVLGQTVTSELTDALLGLTRALQGSGGMAGSDPGGTTWASAYDHAAAVTVGGMVDLINACYKLAAMLELTGFNHGLAESSSDPTGSAPTPPDTSHYAAPGTLGQESHLPSAAGGSGRPPNGWGLVQRLVGYVWPNGNQDTLRAAARVWSETATAVSAAAYAIPEALHAIRSQQAAEVEHAARVCQAMMDHIVDVASGCRDLSTACSDYADHIEHAHRDVEDELKSLIEWTIAIEAAGAIVGVFSLGIGEGAAQVVEVARVAATASRVGNIIARLIEFASSVAVSIGNVATRVAEVAQRLKAVLGARLTRVTAEEVGRLPSAVKDAEVVAANSIQRTADVAVADDIVVGSEVTYPDRAAARQALEGNCQVAANRFFKGATSKSQDFQITELQGGGYRLEFFSPANNPGYGKLYVQEIDSAGQVVRRYKDTLGPDGLIERKWMTEGS